MEQPSSKRFIAIGSMLFALFFGAGNLIFPAAMGQSAGANVWWAVLGFCVTGVGLPLLGIIAVGYSGCRDLREVASRVHPLYGLLYGCLLHGDRPLFRHSSYGHGIFRNRRASFPRCRSVGICAADLPRFLFGDLLLAGCITIKAC